MQKILESIKQRVEIPSECSEFSSRTEEQYGEKVYNFTWNEKDGNRNISKWENMLINQMFVSN